MPAADWVRSFAPPVGDRRFWLVQFGVVTLALIHDVVLVALHAHELAGVPTPVTAALMLIPVVYAALNFGVRGAVGTALWASMLIVPHWFISSTVSAAHLWIELAYLVILNTVALVVGQRVESEQQARERAEVASARYRALFDEQPAPVITTDEAGVIGEVNSAATRLFGRSTSGRDVKDVLGAGLDELLDGRRSALTLRAASGETRRFVPTAHRVGADGHAELVQVILTDVTEQQRRHEEQLRFSRQLLTVQEDERRRLAQELHDDPLQNLTYLSRAFDDLSLTSDLPAETSQRLQHSAAVAAEAAAALRKVIHGLRPPVLDDLGLVSALRQLAEQTTQRAGLAVDLGVRGVEVRLPPEIELAAYRVVQESLTNVVRHAKAKRAGVTLQYGDCLVITVTDDGRGVGTTVGRRVASDTGLGLVGMRERVNMSGGTLDIRRRSPHGTRVRAVLPLTQTAKG